MEDIREQLTMRNIRLLDLHNKNHLPLHNNKQAEEILDAIVETHHEVLYEHYRL